MQAHPNPAAWLDGQERAFALEGVDDPGETPWGRLLLDDAGRQGAYWRDKIARALELCPCDANLDANYAPSLSATLAALDAFVEEMCIRDSPRTSGENTWGRWSVMVSKVSSAPPLAWG